MKYIGTRTCGLQVLIQVLADAESRYRRMTRRLCTIRTTPDHCILTTTASIVWKGRPGSRARRAVECPQMAPIVCRESFAHQLSNVRQGWVGFCLVSEVQQSPQVSLRRPIPATQGRSWAPPRHRHERTWAGLAGSPAQARHVLVPYTRYPQPQ